MSLAHIKEIDPIGRRSGVYLLSGLIDGKMMYYVGESDDLLDRLLHHRAPATFRAFAKIGKPWFVNPRMVQLWNFDSYGDGVDPKRSRLLQERRFIMAATKIKLPLANKVTKRPPPRDLKLEVEILRTALDLLTPIANAA